MRASIALLAPIWPRSTGVSAQSYAPIPVSLPADDAPHDVPLEWWYYTGHLDTASGDQYGFEFVVFKGQQNDTVGYVAHVAVTDNPRDRFVYDQRLEIVESAQGAGSGFELAVGDWLMRGNDGRDSLTAAVDGYGFDLTLTASKPPVLHDGDGYLDYQRFGYSYYYSRTRLAVSGSLTIDGAASEVTGDAWFDHQWGDFTTFRDAKWHWYALQLDDGTELMVYQILSLDDDPLFLDATLVEADGTATILTPAEVLVTASDSWTSPRSGLTYPSGWTIALPGDDAAFLLTPTQLDQELDTRLTTGVIYWEGQVTVSGVRAGQPVDGRGYVEMTGLAVDPPLA